MLLMSLLHDIVIVVLEWSCAATCKGLSFRLVSFEKETDISNLTTLLRKPSDSYLPSKKSALRSAMVASRAYLKPVCCRFVSSPVASRDSKKSNAPPWAITEPKPPVVCRARKVCG
eukprot:Gb_24339 [translate_table: standard]